MELPDNIENKIFRSGVDSCWYWIGVINKKSKYGQVKTYPHRGRQAHCVVYEFLKGPIPESLQLDHLCRNRRCVNPEHLEPVTQRVNVLRGESGPAVNARKTHCIAGHELTLENTYAQGKDLRNRGCKECRKRRGLAWYHKQRGTNGNSGTST